MSVVSWQPLARFSVAHDQRLVRLAAVGDEDDVAKPGRLLVLGQLDAVGLVESRDLLGILAVVHEIQLGEKHHATAG